MMFSIEALSTDDDDQYQKAYRFLRIKHGIFWVGGYFNSFSQSAEIRVGAVSGLHLLRSRMDQINGPEREGGYAAIESISR